MRAMSLTWVIKSANRLPGGAADAVARLRSTLDQIAAALQVSPFHLSRVFSQESDFSLFGYLATVRLTKARQLLLEEDLPVAEVAYAVGYASPNYFAKVFRKAFGHPPSRTRSQ